MSLYSLRRDPFVWVQGVEGRAPIIVSGEGEERFALNWTGEKIREAEGDPGWKGGSGVVLSEEGLSGLIREGRLPQETVLEIGMA